MGGIAYMQNSDCFHRPNQRFPNKSSNQITHRVAQA